MSTDSATNDVLTISAAAPLIAERRLTPTALIEACLDRIKRFEDDVKAWVVVDEEKALATARQATEEIAGGQYRGPLHGIPLGVKDIIDVAGLPTRCGSKLGSDQPAKTDADVVRTSRAAGAIIFGKTVTTEFACFEPSQTHNPWNTDYSPGGSSSGSAAAVACRMCLGALGTQTGGSITRPASYCGVAGLKPTLGRISREGVFPVSEMLDHVGALAPAVRDLALIYEVLCQEDARGQAAPEGASWKLGVPEQYFRESASDDVREATEEAVAKLEAAGAELHMVELPPSFADVHTLHRRVMAHGVAEVHRNMFAKEPFAYSDSVAKLIGEGFMLTADDYEIALAPPRQSRHPIAAVAAGRDAAFHSARAGLTARAWAARSPGWRARRRARPTPT